MASFDVVSLYTFSHDGGVQAVSKALMSADLSNEGKEFLISLLLLVLTLNYFVFEDRFYLQMRGTAMGANMAPTYASIFVSMLEEERVCVSHHLRNVLEWWRYIDNVFFLFELRWIHDLGTLKPGGLNIEFIVSNHMLR